MEMRKLRTIASIENEFGRDGESLLRTKPLIGMRHGSFRRNKKGVFDDTYKDCK